MISYYKSIQPDNPVELCAFEITPTITPDEVVHNMKLMWPTFNSDDVKFTTDNYGRIVSITYPHGLVRETIGVGMFIIKDSFKLFSSLSSANFKTYYREVK